MNNHHINNNNNNNNNKRKRQREKPKSKTPQKGVIQKGTLKNNNNQEMPSFAFLSRIQLLISPLQGINNGVAGRG